jgi:hypothetical protein
MWLDALSADYLFRMGLASVLAAQINQSQAAKL